MNTEESEAALSKYSRFNLFSLERGQIITGIISGLLVIYFIDPIFSFLGRHAINISTYLFSSYLDHLYSEIATSEPNFGFLGLLLVAGSTVGFSAGLITGMVKDAFVKLPPSQEKPKSKSKIATLIPLLFIFFASIFVSVDSYIRLKTSSTFNQYINVVSPYITDHERKVLIARFSSMRGVADFDNVMHQIEGIAKANNVVLPTNKLYPF